MTELQKDLMEYVEMLTRGEIPCLHVTHSIDTEAFKVDIGEELYLYDEMTEERIF